MTEILDQEHMAPPRSHSQTLDAAASIQARALREGRPWRCGKLGDKTDNARCISRRIQAHKHGKQHAPCHDCTIPAMIQNQKLPLRDTPAAAPVPVVENKENNPMSKRGTCIDCKRPDMSIISGGRCGTCYNKFRKGEKPSAPEQPTAKLTAPQPKEASMSPVATLPAPARPDDNIFPLETNKLPVRDFIVAGIEFDADVRGRAPIGPPMVTFSPAGKMSFSASASAKFDLPKYPYLRLYPSKDRNVLGIKLCSEHMVGTRRLCSDGAGSNSLRSTYHSIAREIPRLEKKTLLLETTEWDTFLLVRVPNE